MKLEKKRILLHIQNEFCKALDNWESIMVNSDAILPDDNQMKYANIKQKFE